MRGQKKGKVVLPGTRVTLLYHELYELLNLFAHGTIADGYSAIYTLLRYRANRSRRVLANEGAHEEIKAVRPRRVREHPTRPGRTIGPNSGPKEAQ